MDADSKEKKTGKVKDPRSRIELKESPGENLESPGQRVYSEVNRLIGPRASGGTIENISPKQCSIVLMESHIFYSNTRGKKLFQLPSHARVHEMISFDAIFFPGET